MEIDSSIEEMVTATTVKVIIEIIRKAGPGLGVLEGADLIQTEIFELDPNHADLRFAGTANEGWPSQYLTEIGFERFPEHQKAKFMESLLTAHGALVINGLVLKRNTP